MVSNKDLKLALEKQDTLAIMAEIIKLRYATQGKNIPDGGVILKEAMASLKAIGEILTGNPRIR